MTRLGIIGCSLFLLCLSGSPLIGQINGVQVNVTSMGHDILGDAANEPSIAVDPNNPDRMAIGWRQFFTITSNFVRPMSLSVSTEGRPGPPIRWIQVNFAAIRYWMMTLLEIFITPA
jgi:hypothetical protein